MLESWKVSYERLPIVIKCINMAGKPCTYDKKDDSQTVPRCQRLKIMSIVTEVLLQDVERYFERITMFVSKSYALEIK